MVPGGRGAGSEKILPICARAGGASETVVAITRATGPLRAMARNISCGFNGRIGLLTIVQGYSVIRRSQGNRLTRRIRRGKGGFRPLPGPNDKWNSPPLETPRGHAPNSLRDNRSQGETTACPIVFAWTTRSP